MCCYSFGNCTLSIGEQEIVEWVRRFSEVFRCLARGGNVKLLSILELQNFEKKSPCWEAEVKPCKVDLAWANDSVQSSPSIFIQLDSRISRQFPPHAIRYGGKWRAADMSYFFSTPVDIDIVLEDGDERQMVDMKTEKGRREKAPLYKDGESVKGAVTIRPKDGKRLEHTGIKVQFIGTIGELGP